MAGGGRVGGLPGVVEGQAGDGCGGAAGEHADLVAVGVGVEVTADDERRSRVLSLMNVGEQFAHRELAGLALVEPPGVHHQAEYLDQAARAR